MLMRTASQPRGLRTRIISAAAGTLVTPIRHAPFLGRAATDATARASALSRAKLAERAQW